MPLGDWWVDEKGDINSSSEIDSSLDALFFRHLGQVKLYVRPGEVDIHWDTGHVMGDALPSVLDRLIKLKSKKKVRLSFYYFGWASEDYDKSSAAISRILQIQQSQFVDLLHPTLINSLNVGDVELASPLLKRAFKIWERTKGQFDDIAQEEFSEYLPNILIFRPDKNDEKILFSWIGSKTTAINVYGHQWAKYSIGQVSNKSFGLESQFHADRVSSGIAHTMRTGEPSLHHIRSLMDIDGQEPFWVSYERLLTRHTLHDGKPGVVCTVNEIQEISIPLAGGFHNSGNFQLV